MKISKNEKGMYIIIKTFWDKIRRGHIKGKIYHNLIVRAHLSKNQFDKGITSCWRGTEQRQLQG